MSLLLLPGLVSLHSTIKITLISSKGTGVASLRAPAFMKALRTNRDIPTDFLIGTFGWERGFHKISLFCPFQQIPF